MHIINVDNHTKRDFMGFLSFRCSRYNITVSKRRLYLYVLYSTQDTYCIYSISFVRFYPSLQFPPSTFCQTRISQLPDPPPLIQPLPPVGKKKEWKVVSDLYSYGLVRSKIIVQQKYKYIYHIIFATCIIILLCIIITYIHIYIYIYIYGSGVSTFIYYCYYTQLGRRRTHT